MRPFSALVCAGLLLAMVATAGAATLNVGPSRTYTKIQDAINAAHDGDLILVDSGTYVGRDCTMVFFNPVLHNITVRGVGPTRPVLDMGTDHSVSIWGKGICTVEAGGDITFENLEFTRAAGRDLAPWNDTGHNGAAIRYNGSGLLTIRNCYIHDCEEGVLTSSLQDYNVLIEYCEFNHNGYGQGSTHNMYIGGSYYPASFTLRYSYIHRAHTGHEVKSRAQTNYILYNRIMNEDGDGSYEIDIPNGGTTYIIGNIIQQGPNTENGRMVCYAEEGPVNQDQHLYFINNTVSSERGASATFVLNNSPVDAVLKNNLFLGSTEGAIDTILAGPPNSTSADNVLCNVNYNNGGTTHGPSAYLVSPGAPNYNYHLTSQSTVAIDAGVYVAMGLEPVSHYAHPCNYVARPTTGAYDIGAYEYMAGPAVRAGDAQTAREGDLVQLQAACDDPNGGTVTYNWTQLVGKAVTLAGSGTAAPSFTVPTVSVFPEATMLFQVAVNGGASDMVDVRVYMLGDFDRNDAVDVIDLLDFVAAFGTSVGDPAYNAACDLNPDGTIDVIDLLTFVPNFGRTL